MPQSLLEKTEKSELKPFVKPRRAWILIGLEFFVVLVFGLLLLEPIFSFAGVANEEVLDIEPVTGWTLMPNRSFTYRKEGFSQSTINSHGMRDVERSLVKPANTYRIAVVGCSVTEGNQVAISDTYCSVLERKLNKDNPGKHFEVLNFAVSAYTLGQEYLRLKNFALRFQPDMVVFTVRPNALLYMGPDNKAGFYNARPVFGVMPDGRLIEDHHFQQYWLSTSDGRRMQATRWLRYNSRLWGVVGKCTASLNEFKLTMNRKLRQLTKNPFGTNVSPEAPATAPSGLVDAQPIIHNEATQKAQAYLGTVADRIIEEAKRVTMKANCKFVLTYLPATKKYRDAEEELIIREIARKQGIPYLDLNESFDQIEKTSANPLYVVVHPSKDGHQKMAELLFSYFRANRLLE